jgi:hypothetical protein
MSSVIRSISNTVVDLGVFGWDALLTVYNFVTPNLAEGHVVPKGHPGEGGKWPEYIPPTETDSRSACPALNAMANHGVCPRRVLIHRTDSPCVHVHAVVVRYTPA